jgi:hypothetical protein
VPDPERSDEQQATYDRQLSELLQELRIAMPGVQVLFAFLLAVPFQQRFGEIGEVGRGVYLFTLLCAAASSALLVAPASYHRIMFKRGDKARIIRYAERSAITGLAFLALSMTGAVLLVTTFLFGDATAAIATGGVFLVFAWLWFGLGWWRR